MLVVRTDAAAPLPSVTTTLSESVPDVVVKVTGVATNGLPFISSTLAVTVVEPPMEGTGFGLALTVTLPTAAVPTKIFSAPVVPVVAPPEIAVIVAVPFDPPAMNVAVTRPLMSVSTSPGSIRPIVVVNDTCVPLWGGVPAASRICAVIVAVPLADNAVVDAVSVMDDPVGARSGTFWQATALSKKPASASHTATARKRHVNIGTVNILLP